MLRFFRLPPSRPVVVAGSTMRGEEAAVLRAFARVRTTMPAALAILAPRQPERFGEVERLARDAGFVTVRRSELPIDAEPRADVVVLDTIGELAQLYQVATAVFVGGSLVDHGGHNILEPAVFGKPIVFGPHMQNFTEIADAFLDQRRGLQVQSERELEDALLTLVTDPVRRARLGAAARALVEANRGAKDKTLAVLADLLPRPARAPWSGPSAWSIDPAHALRGLRRGGGVAAPVVRARSGRRRRLGAAGRQRRQPARRRQRQDAGRRARRAAARRRGRAAGHSQPRLRPARRRDGRHGRRPTAARSSPALDQRRRRAADAGARARRACPCSSPPIAISRAGSPSARSARRCTSWTTASSTCSWRATSICWLVDESDLDGRGRCPPGGCASRWRRRRPPTRSWWTRATTRPPTASAAALDARQAFRVTRTLGAPRTVPLGDTVVVPSGARVFAVAGIARPERFFADLTAAGWQVVGTMSFRDHHRFDARDVERIARGRASRRARRSC